MLQRPGQLSGRYSNTVALAYDDAGRKKSEALTVLSQTYTVACGHDAANRDVECTYPDGSVVTREYTDRDQLERLLYDADGGGILPALLVDTRVYDPGMRMATQGGPSLKEY